jgi:hypothetical protein
MGSLFILIYLMKILLPMLMLALERTVLGYVNVGSLLYHI